MVDDQVEKTALNLSILGSGSRAWYAWRVGDAPELVVIPVNEDLAGREIRQRIIEWEQNAEPVFGLLHRDFRGQYSFVGERVPPLDKLIDWVRAHVEDAPGLAALVGAVNRRVDGDGMISSERADWGDLGARSAPVALSSIEYMGQRLATLPVGERAWIWMAGIGPDDAPGLVVTRQKFDPKGEAFTYEVQHAVSCAPNLKQVVLGVVARSSDGSLNLITNAPAQGAAMVCRQVAGYPVEGVAALGEARIGQTQGDDLVRAMSAVADLSGISETIARLEANTPCGFCLVELASGDSVLILGETPEQLKAARETVEGQRKRSVKGRMRINEKGRAEFQTRKPFDDFLPLLARFVNRNRERWPAFERLNGARFSVRDAEGAVIEKHSDSSLWA